MARAAQSDFLHSMRFHVTTDFGTQNSPLNIQFDGSGTTEVPAGFMSCTTPEATTEAVEYREGTFNYARKFPGNTTVSDVTLQKGVTQGNSRFWAWLRVVIEGSGDYRCNMSIKHFNRNVLARPVPPSAGAIPNATNAATTATPSRTYQLYEAFPIRHKVAADLDASSSDISIMELDVAYEYFDVEENPQEVKSA